MNTLARLMKRHKLGDKDVAELVGSSRPAVRNWRLGFYRPSAAYTFKLAEALSKYEPDLAFNPQRLLEK